jgi:hypothetical protein
MAATGSEFRFAPRLFSTSASVEWRELRVGEYVSCPPISPKNGRARK